MISDLDRLKKLEKIKEQKIDPYPARCRRTHTLRDVILNFEKLAKKSQEINLVGRLILLRLHGKLCFAHLEDGTGRFQICLRYDKLGQEQYKFFLENIDIGDFLEAEGKLFTTKRGEKTLEVLKWQLLAKALLPLPEKWHGLSDIEMRFRKRYLDLVANSKVREIFVKRSKLIKLIRDFFDSRDFLEVETPTLQPIPGGAVARPFVTHHQALDMDLYLRIAPELYLKRLIIGGFERVYEIARCFRNEGIDRAHNPEFTQIEFYQAYADYNELMKLTEELMEFLLKNLEGKFPPEADQPLAEKIEYQAKILNFKPPYPHFDFRELLLKRTGIDIEKEKDLKTLVKKVRALGLEIDKTWARGKIIDEIYKEKVRPKLINPTFLINHPIELSPLAKQIPDRPGYVERFQLLAAGTEICNGFSELNDPIEQEKRFREQQELLRVGDREAQRFDEDFLEALKHGMPPTAGEGIGIDRLALILTNTYNIREVILFPTLRPKEK